MVTALISILSVIVLVGVLGFFIYRELKRRGATLMSSIYNPKRNLKVGDVFRETRLSFKFIPISFIRPGKIEKKIKGSDTDLYLLEGDRIIFTKTLDNPTEKEEGYMIAVEYGRSHPSYADIKEMFDRGVRKI